MRLERHHIIAIVLAIVLLLIVFAAGPAQGQDTNVPGDGMTCVEKWVCDAGRDCDDGFRGLTCRDQNQCGTELEIPPQKIPCDPDYQDDGCVERWVCTPWSECWSDGLEHRMCEDANACRPTHTAFPYTRNCTIQEPPDCDPDWTCSDWSDCSNGAMYRHCYDSNNCGGSDSYVNETKECTSTIPPPACEPDWHCANWSECIQGHKVRECIDRSQCGTLEGMPEQTMPCDAANPQLNETCNDEWVCSKWTECDGQLRRRTCNDVNGCSSESVRMEQEACQIQCFENWRCGSWSACADSNQVRQCNDINACNNIPPVVETRHCEMPPKPPANDTANQTQPPHIEPKKEANRTYDEINPGEPARLFPDSPNSTVSQISLSMKKRIVNASISFLELESPPETIPPEPPDNPNTGVFRYMSISNENIDDDDIDSATVDFQVTKNWLRERLINVSTVRLRRFSGNLWQDLPTTLLYDDNERFYFQAETPGFSIFAIAGEFMLQKSGGGLMCLPLDIRCYESDVQECDIDGLSWTIIEECEHGCSSPGVCRSEPAEQSPVSGEDYVMILMLALLVIIAVLGFVVMFFRIKRKKISQELNRPVTTPGIGK